MSIGYNNYSRFVYPFKKFNGYKEYNNLHAEEAAIKKCFKSQLKGGIIIVWGITKAGNKILSKPCKPCINAIKAVGIKKIIYFDKLGKKYIEKV